MSISVQAVCSSLQHDFLGATQQIVGRERRERASQLAWCEVALIRVAASTLTFGGSSF
jgi:hypothetical protein